MLSETQIILLVVAAAVLAILAALGLAKSLLSLKVENEKVRQIQQAIREGAEAYLTRQAKVVSVAALVIFIVLFKFFGLSTAVAFLAGSFTSGLCGFLGMSVSVRANARVAEAAGRGFAPAFKLAVRGGAVTGFLVASLALLLTTLSYYYFVFVSKEGLTPMIGLAFGASLISVFARVGGGIYTKAADVGTDLVGKVEAGIPEDDPRNPGVIADNVGDNVGDCAGMAADLFETYAVTLISTILLARLLFPQNPSFQILPLALGAVALMTSLLSLVVVRGENKEKTMTYLYRGLLTSLILSAVFFLFLISYLFALETRSTQLHLYLSALLGLSVTLALVFLTDYYTSKNFGPVREIAAASVSGHATNIIAGLSVSMKATFLPVVLLSLAAFAAYQLSGLYGVAISAMSLLSLAAIIVAIDSFGPITDNAGGIAEMANLSSETRQVTDSLDAVGNTTKAVTKGYAIGSAVLSALVIFAVYSQELGALGKTVVFSLSDPYVLVGLFFGAGLPYLFGAWTMQAVGQAAGSVVTEIRRQFKEIPGIMEGKALPDYRRAVDIVTQAALSNMVLPALLPVVAPLLVGFILGAKALGGLLMGSLLTGVFVAISMTTGGAAWDNAKKFIEGGALGGKGSLAHQAAVTGDTVGDPYKDAAGPAINPMIKIINIVALLIVRYI